MSSKPESKDIKGVNSRHQFVATEERYTFGTYLLDGGSRMLSRGGERLAVTPKALDVLLQLVRNPGRVIPKEEFFRISGRTPL